MKTIHSIRGIIVICFLLTLSSACSKKESEIEQDDSGKTGTFKIDGVAYTGETSILTIGGVYTVTCQRDSPLKLIQVVFDSKEEAEKGGTFKVTDFTIKRHPGEVEVGIDGLTFDPDGDFTVTVKNKKITMSNVKLLQTGNGGKKPVVNECSIEF